MKKVNVEKNAAEFIYQDDIHVTEHDKNLWNARQKRDTAAAQIPEWEELRNLASAIKEHTLTHLDQYLEQFVTNAEKMKSVWDGILAVKTTILTGATWLWNAALAANPIIWVVLVIGPCCPALSHDPIV